MKKLVLTLGIVLTMGLCASAQSLLQREDLDFNDRTEATIPVIPNYGQTDDQEGTSPLDSGIAVLVGLGAVYLVGRKRSEEE